MPNLEDIIRAQRKRLLEKEADLIAAISGDFNAAIAELESRAIDAAALVQKRIDQGENPLSAQITERRIGTFLEAVGDIISDVALDALNYTLADRKSAQIAAASDFVDAANASDVRAGIDPDAIRRIALGINAPDSPIRRLFANLPELAQSRARDALFQGVALGDNPRQTGRRVAAAAGIAKARAQTIARTETMRAYRNGTLDRMQVTPEIHRWVWISARDRRTCAMCWAMHGRVFSTERQMGTHPNCRCSMGPLPLGANTTAIVGNGKALFDKLKPSEQLQILGGAKYRAFKNGAIDLNDLIGTAQHVDWGEIRYERSLSSVLGKTNAMKYYKSAINVAGMPPPVTKAPKPVAAPKPKPTPKPPAPKPAPVAPVKPPTPPTPAELVSFLKSKNLPPPPPPAAVLPPPPKPKAAPKPKAPAATATPPPKAPKIKKATTRPARKDLVDWNLNPAWDVVRNTQAGGRALPEARPGNLSNWEGRSPLKNKVATEVGNGIQARINADPAKYQASMDYFNRNITGLRPEKPAGYYIADKFVSNWAGTSADNNSIALAIQIRAGEKYGVPMPAYLQKNLATARVALDGMTPLIDAFLDATYAHTQKAFKDAGVKEVTLYRGQTVALPKTPAPGTQFVYMDKVNLQPISSFSVDPGMALSFSTSGVGNYSSLIAMKVPASQIFSATSTGFGCLNEGEIVVIGGVDVAAHVVVNAAGRVSPFDWKYEPVPPTLKATLGHDSAPTPTDFKAMRDAILAAAATP